MTDRVSKNIIIHRGEDVKQRFIILQKKWMVKKELTFLEELVLAERRQLKPIDKEIVWNGSRTCDGFDKKIFRIDILGNIVIKNIKYNNNSVTKKFACEYEHIISYSHGGETTIENIGLLNAGINRSTGDNECFSYTYLKLLGYNSEFGITPELLKAKLHNLHETCQEYDLYFKQEYGVWTIKNYNYYDENKCRFPIPKKPLKDNDEILNYCNKVIHDLSKDDENDIVKILIPIVCVVAGIVIIGSTLYGGILFFQNRQITISNELKKQEEDKKIYNDIKERMNDEPQHFKLPTKDELLIYIQQQDIERENEVLLLKASY